MISHVLLTLALAAGPDPSVSPDLSGSGGPASPTTGQSPGWAEGGYHLGARDWAGAPAPSIDCIADASGGGMTCTGATATKVGSPTTVGSPFYPSGYAGPQQMASALSGSGQYFWAPHVAVSNLSVCSIFNVSDNGYRRIVGEDSNPRSWSVFTSGAQVFMSVFSDNSTNSTIAVGAAPVGAFTVNCTSYLYTSPGASIIRGNSNGTAATGSSTAIGPIQSTADRLTIGITDGTVGGQDFYGALSRVTIWTNWAASASDLAAMVASQIGLVARKPANTVLPFTRADVGFVCPVVDSQCYWLGAGIPEIDRRGIWVGGAASNLLGYSNTFASWAADATVTVADASASCPVGPLGTAMSLVTSGTDGNGIKLDGTAGTERNAWMAAATGDSACAVTMSDYAAAHAADKSLTSTVARFDSATAGDHGIAVVRKTGGCARWCMQAAANTATLVPIPYRATAANAPYTGPATTHQGVSPRAAGTAGPWAISITATCPLWTSGALWSMGTAGAANSASLTMGATLGTLIDYDGASGTRSSTWTHGLAANGTHTLLAGSIPMVSVEGTTQTLTTTGAGTGIAAMPSTLYLGQTSVAGSQDNCWLQKWATCTRTGGCR